MNKKPFVILAPYSFFFIPYSEPVLTFSLPCLRGKQKRKEKTTLQKLYSLPLLSQLLSSVHSVVASVLLWFRSFEFGSLEFVWDLEFGIWIEVTGRQVSGQV
jgi:hypothetical protein